MGAKGHTFDIDNSASTENGLVPRCGVMHLGNEYGVPFLRTQPRVGAVIGATLPAYW
jgi:hypothetical protein